MIRAFLFVLLILALLAAGCAPGQTATPQPVLPAQQGIPASSGDVVASAVVVPILDSSISFVIPGTVKEIAVEEGDKVQAGQTLMVLDAPELEYAVTQAEAALRAAEFEYQYWIPPRFDRPPERRQLAEQQLLKVQASLETARAELTQAALGAPFDGTIVRIDVASGEWVEPGQIVITVASLDRFRIETTDLSERDLLEVHIGQPATILIEALGAEFAGEVIAISPKANLVGGDVVYKVTLELETQPPDLLWGMSAEVQFTAE